MKFFSRVGLLACPAAGGALLVCLVAAQPPAPIQFTDVTAQAGIRFTHNAGRAGKKYLPETLGSGCAFFDADGDGWPDILLINSKDWTPRGRKSLCRPLPQQPQRHLHQHHRRQRPRRRDVRHGRGHRRLRQRRPRRRLHHRARRRPPLPQRRQRQVPRRHQGRRHPERQLRHQRRLARLRPRRQAGSLRRQLRPVDAEERPLVLARRRHQVLLHARILQGHALAASTTTSAAAVSRTSPQSAGIGDPTSKSLGRHRPRLQRRRLARPLRRQRHAAQQALPQQPATAPSPKRA